MWFPKEGYLELTSPFLGFLLFMAFAFFFLLLLLLDVLHRYMARVSIKA